LLVVTVIFLNSEQTQEQFQFLHIHLAQRSQVALLIYIVCWRPCNLWLQPS